MKKSKSKETLKVDPYLEGFMNKLLDRLVAIERKMDTLVNQTIVKKDSTSYPVIQSSQPQQAPRRERQLYEAICADCSKVCEVPFKPSEDRAVYCKTCFAKRKSGHLPHGMPKLTAVTLLPKPVSKLSTPTISISKPQSSKKTKKAPSKKKNKK